MFGCLVSSSSFSSSSSSSSSSSYSLGMKMPFFKQKSLEKFGLK